MNKLYSILSIAFLAFVFNACVDQDFDEPTFDDLVPQPTHTIGELLGQYPPDQFLVIEDGTVIDGVVISDDADGNFFRELIIQDETGGILIRLDRTNLSAEFPMGRQVFIDVSGLAVGNFAGLPQLGVLGMDGGDPTTDRIPDALIGDILYKGQLGAEVAIKDVNSISELVFSDINTLVRLNNVEFRMDQGTTFATPGGSSSVNQNVDFCNGDEIIVRNSDFASFAEQQLPQGSGPLVGVLGVFNDDFQVKIRTTEDVAGMTNSRCGACTGNETLVSIQDLRDMFSGSAMNIDQEIKVVGVAISDRANANTTGRNLVIQDASAGIVARFVGNHSIDLNEEVEICLTGAELSEFNGLMQINNLDLSKATVVGTGSVTAQNITISEYNANARAYESELLVFDDALISGGSTYSSANTISDATGSTDIFTYNSSTFADASVPSEAGQITCIGSVFNEAQVYIRNTDDVEKHGGSSGGDPTAVDVSDVRATFTGSTTTYSGNEYIQGIVISDQSNMNTTDRNLVLQDGDAGIVVRFESAHSFALGDEIQVVIRNVELSEFNGLLQVNNVPIANATLLGAGTLPTPRLTTIGELLSNAEAWESTLVRLEGVTISGAGTYSGTLTISDGTDNIEMFTRSQASFANSSVASGSVNMNAVVSEFENPQVFIRNLDDIN